MLRGLLALLLVANLVVLAWTRGWLAPAWPGPRHGEREPERLALQMRPERVVVLPPVAASAAVSAARAASRLCLETGPLSEQQVPAAEAALVQAGLMPGNWVRTAPAAGQAAGVWLRLTQMDADTLARARAVQDPALPGAFRPCEPAR